MQESVIKEAVRKSERTEKHVSVFLESSFYLLQGNWHWEMEADAVFCSDVIFSPDGNISGTKAIFYPDDLTVVKEKLKAGPAVSDLEFRIITTYGEVKWLYGSDILVTEESPELQDWEQQSRQLVLQGLELKAAQGHLHLLKEINDRSGRFTGTGNWYYNASTHETWYQDVIFILHGLAPQSLNAHLHTFYSYIHPEDRNLVVEYIDKAFLNKSPLHIDYRILINSKEKWIAYKSFWFYGERGEAVLGGIYQDITEQKKAEREAEAHKALVQFQRQQLLYDEQQVNFGHWQLNLLTRKTAYSDQFHRIFGIKPNSLAPNINSFINHVHPEDRDKVNASFRQMLYEHAVPELEYRIIRGDGKTRHLLQKAKLLMLEQELMVSGIIQDITVQRLLERKITNLQERHSLDARLLQQAHEAGSTVSWVMNLEQKKVEWSESFYRLLGYVKSQPMNITEKTLFSLVHPQDLKAFRSQWEKAVQHKEESSFSFRATLRGALHYMKAIFSVYAVKEQTYFLGVLQDATGQQVLQQQLSQRVQLAESLTENILDRIIITDYNNTILLWSRSCEKAYGRKKGEAIGENFFDVFPHLKTEADLQMIQQALKGSKVVREGLLSYTGNGYYTLHLVPLYQDEAITGVLHVIHDISSETELRARLKDRLQLIENLVEASVDRIIALDRNMNYLYWNRKAEEYYGLPKEEVIGKNIMEVSPEMVNDPSYAEIRKALRGETVYIPVDPEQDNYFETYLIPIKAENGTVSSVLWTVHDLRNEWLLREEQRKTQLQLQKEHQQMKEAQVLGRLGSFKWTVGSPVIYWSEGLCHLLGIEPQGNGISVEKADSFVHPEDLGAFRAVKSQSLLAPGFYSHTYRLVGSIGDVLIVNQEWECLANDEGQVVNLTGIIQDVTEQTEAQKALEKSILLLNDTEDIGLSGSYEADLTTMSFRFSNGMFRLFGEEPNAFVPSLEFIDSRSHPDDLTRVNAVLDEAVKNKHPYHYVRRIYRKDGELRVLEAHGKVETDEQGTAVRLLGMVQDITERTKTEEQILRLKDAMAQRATDKYLTLFNAIDEGFYLCEIIFDKANKPVDVFYIEENPAAVRLTGQSLVGKTLREVSPDYESYWYELFGQVALTGESRRMEQYAAPNEKWFDFYVTRVGDQSNRNLVIVFQDITERRQLAETLQQSEERKSFLLRLSDALRPLSNASDIKVTASRILGEVLQVTRVHYGEVAADDQYVVVDSEYTNGVQALTGAFRMNDFGPEVVQQLRSGQTIVMNNLALEHSISREALAANESLGIRAQITVPLVKEGRFTAVLSVHHKEPRNWTANELAMIEETAERLWAAAERAKAEEALQVSEEHFRTFVTASSDVVFKMNASWTVMYNLEGSDLWADTTNNSSSWIQQYIPEKEQARVVQAIEEATRKKSMFELEHQVFDREGSLIWTYSRAVPKLNENGEIVEWFGAASDITARKKAEEALQNINARLTDILESTTDAFYALDENFHFTYVNGRAAQLWNRSAASLIGRHMWTEFPKAVGGESYLQHHRVMQEWEPVHFQTFSDMLGLWLEIGIYPGEGRSLSVFFRNITDRKQAEEKLQNFTAMLEQQVAERTKELQKNITILQDAEALAMMGSWGYEKDTGNFNWSDGMYRLFNLPQGIRVSPEIYLDAVVEEDRTIAKRILKQLKKANEPFEETMRIKRGHERRLLKIKGSVVKPPNGGSTRMVGVDLDITDIKEAEHKLEESRNLLQQTAMASPDAITIYDLQKKQLAYLNNCLAEWIGSTPEELLKMGVEGRLALFHPDDRLCILHFNEKLKSADDGAVLTLEYRLKRKDDTVLWIRNRAKVFQRNAAGVVTHVLSFLQDITEEKASESHLKLLNAALEKKNTELESKNEEITSFAFVASHDLREPLRKIQTFSDWLLQKEPTLSPSGRQTLDKMTLSVNRLNQLINEILALTRVHAHNEKGKPVDLNKLLAVVQEELQETLEATGAVIEAEPLPTIIGSENQLKYLVTNLITNGVKFQPLNASPKISISAKIEEHFLKIAFTDNGIGIEPAYHKRIFEIFRRLHSRSEYEGTGMGLAISKKVMEKHGGKITVESEPGKGATFICWFPAALSTK